MNTNTALFSILVLFVVTSGFMFLRIKHKNNVRTLLKKISSLIHVNVPFEYLHELGGLYLQVSTHKDSDYISEFLQEVLKQEGYTIFNHSPYDKDGFSFFFKDDTYKHLCEVYHSKNTHDSGSSFWITMS